MSYLPAVSSRHIIHNQSGQGLIEYLIIVALMGVATIGIVRVMGATVEAKFAKVTLALQAKSKEVKVEEVRDNLYKKRDLSNFFNSASDRGSNAGNDAGE